MVPFEIAQHLGIEVGASPAPAATAEIGQLPHWTEATVLAKIVGAIGAQVAFAVQGSQDDEEWFDLPFVDLTGNSLVALVSSVTVAANGTTVAKGIMLLRAATPFVRFVLTGASTGAAVVDLTVIAKM